MLKIKGIPVFYFPFLAWPTTSSRKSGFLAPEFGQDTSNAEKFDLGYRIGIPFFWDFDPEHDLTLKYEWVEKRGFGLHGEYQYAFEGECSDNFNTKNILKEKPVTPRMNPEVSLQTVFLNPN